MPAAHLPAGHTVLCVCVCMCVDVCVRERVYIHGVERRGKKRGILVLAALISSQFQFAYGVMHFLLFPLSGSDVWTEGTPQLVHVPEGLQIM